MLIINKKESTTDAHNIMDDSQEYYAEWKKPDTKKVQIAIPFILIQTSEINA